jgi:putative transposase
MQTVHDLGKRVGTMNACTTLSIPRASFYRWKSPPAKREGPRLLSPRALSVGERDCVIEVLRSERFVDQAPREVYATLLDEGQHLCSPRTMYRILDQHGEVRERRDQLRHPAYTKPELLATAPNQVWSWDITKLLGLAKWTHYHLYVILDILSRYVTGWMVATRESAALAEKLIRTAAERQGIEPGQLTIHADRGASMRSKPVALLLADLGITKTHSRPHVSDDNPYSEAQFKTLKYRPEFPERFGSLEDARAHCAAFFRWYNHEHHHSGLNLFTPAAVHFGEHAALLVRRQATMDVAFAKNPERFVRGAPRLEGPPREAWINRPTAAAEKTTRLEAAGREMIDQLDLGHPWKTDTDDHRVRAANELEVSTLACANGAQ